MPTCPAGCRCPTRSAPPAPASPAAPAHVRIVEDAIPAYAATLPAESPPAPDLAPGASDEERAAFGLQLNAVNFGSGWFPTLRKPPGLTGFRTVEAGLRPAGPWTRRRSTRSTPPRWPPRSGRTPSTSSWRCSRPRCASSARCAAPVRPRRFLALARAGDGTAVEIAEHLAALPTWPDLSPYDGEDVPFFKRAQLSAADLHLQGSRPRDVAALTMFSDNLVPHVLRIDGVLEFDPDLVARIDAGS